MQHRFTSTTFLLLSGLLTWLADFVVVYGFAAVACARGFAGTSLLGLPIVTLVTLLTSAIAGVVTVLIVRRGYRLQDEAATDEPTRFIGFVTFACGGLALVALVLLVLPVMVMTACPRL